MRNALTKAAALALVLAPAAVRAEVRIGYVDLQRALNEVDEGKTAKALLKHDFDEKQKQLDGKKAEFDKAQAEFEKQAVVMSDTARRDKGQDLDRRARELQALFVNLQKDLSEREREATRGIFEKMSAVVRDIAEAEGFTMVLEKGTGIVYAPESLDLTNDLIRKYNARYPATAKKGEPAPKKEGAKKPEAAPPAPKK
jgi:outer membrane protein